MFPFAGLRQFCIPCAAAVLTIAMTGCGGSSEEQIELPGWLSGGAETADGSDSKGGNSGEITNNPFAAKAAAMTEDPLQATTPVTTEAAPPAAGAETLMLALRAGDQLPLTKIVETRLDQSSAGQPTEATQSRVQLNMTISVLQTIGDRAQLGVRYDRIIAQRSSGGVETRLDTSSPDSAAAPPELAGYRALVGNGFRYWVDRTNRVLAVEGLDELMSRAGAGLPPEAARSVATLLGAVGDGEAAVQELIDPAIGLLPYGGQMQPGTSWDRARTVGGPVAAVSRERVTVASVTPDHLTLRVEGRVDPSAPIIAEGLQVESRGGQIQANCEVYRRTGLPRQVQRIETLEMVVRGDDGTELTQNKQTVTTITTGQPTAVVANPPGGMPSYSRPAQQQPAGQFGSQPRTPSQFGQQAGQPSYGQQTYGQQQGVPPAAGQPNGSPYFSSQSAPNQQMPVSNSVPGVPLQR